MHQSTCASTFCITVAMAALLTGCGNESDGDRRGGAAAGVSDGGQGVQRSTALPPAPTRSPKSTPLWFVNKTHDAGITMRVETGSKEKLFIPESIGHGVMVFDYDNDDDLDLYFANGGELRPVPTGRIHWNGLWRNDGGWKFTDVTEGSGLECPEWSTGVYWVDFDGDGFQDVYVTQLGKNRLFRNLDGTGKFADVTDAIGGGCDRYGTSAVFFDADADGDLDLYVGNYLDFDIMNPPNKGVPCRWKELSVCCGPRGLVESVDRFYEWDGGKYVDRTVEFGFHNPDRSGKPQGSYTLGVVAADFDNDGDIDVYVSVDSRPSLMFENVAKGSFKEVALKWQVALNIDALEQAGMGVATHDVNRDGKLDLFKTHFSHDTNTLYINAGTPGNIYFLDQTTTCGLGGEASYPWLSWGTGIIDFNCDGRLDIFVASGHVYPQAEGVNNLGTAYAQPNQLFMAQPEKELHFKDMARSAGPALAEVEVSRGTSFADFDRDGRMDIVVVNLDSWPSLIRNESDIIGKWIGFELEAENRFNRRAVGARVVIVLDDGTEMLQEVVAGGGYLGANDYVAHFGIDGRRTPREVRITWPDGRKESIEAPAAGSWYRLKQGGPAPTRLPSR